MKTLMETLAQTAHLKPNVVTYNTYIGRLMMEGSTTTAQEVVHVDMQSANVDPNQKTRATLELSADDLSKLRTTKLKQWLWEGGDAATAAAWALFHQLVERNVANTFHFTTLLKACHDSSAMHQLLQTVATYPTVTATVDMYNVYVSRLMLEGKYTEAWQVVSEDMRKLRLGSTQVTYDALNSSVAELKELRHTKINALLKRGSQSESAAECLLLELHGKQLAERQHYYQMVDHFVHKDAEGWEVHKDRGVLLWYRLGKEAYAATRTDVQRKPTLRRNRWSKMSVHVLTRGVATVKVVDRLLQLRAQWDKLKRDDAAAADAAVTNVTIVVGKGNLSFNTFAVAPEVLRGAVTNVLKDKFAPSIAAVVDAENTGRLIVQRNDVLRWFKSAQAEEWSVGMDGGSTKT